MLVLQRKPGEAIIIDGNIRVSVLEVRGADGNVRVRLGIEAPKEVVVDREEIHLLKHPPQPIPA